MSTHAQDLLDGKAWRVGIDGGGSKTEGILVGPDGAVAGRALGAGCNPNVIGAPKAREHLSQVLADLFRQGTGIGRVVLCTAGSRPFWASVRDDLKAGRPLVDAVQFPPVPDVDVLDDAAPVLELATAGRPGLVLHAGTGSFIAARTPAGDVRYAGGLGWRFGDEASGYDLGRRALARFFLELQGSAPSSALGHAMRAACGDHDLPTLIDGYYRNPSPNASIAALAPEVLRLALEGEPAAVAVARDSVVPFAALATQLADQLFAELDPRSLPAGVSGPILNHPAILPLLSQRVPFTLSKVEGSPIEGVRRILCRTGSGSQ